jgi:hypothetical protein
MDGRRVDLREPNDHLPMITILFIIVCVAAILLYGEKQKEKKQQNLEKQQSPEKPETQTNPKKAETPEKSPKQPIVNQSSNRQSSNRKSIV